MREARARRVASAGEEPRRAAPSDPSSTQCASILRARNESTGRSFSHSSAETPEARALPDRADQRRVILVRRAGRLRAGGPETRVVGDERARLLELVVPPGPFEEQRDEVARGLGLAAAGRGAVDERERCRCRSLDQLEERGLARRCPAAHRAVCRSPARSSRVPPPGGRRWSGHPLVVDCERFCNSVGNPKSSRSPESVAARAGSGAAEASRAGPSR